MVEKKKTPTKSAVKTEKAPKPAKAKAARSVSAGTQTVEDAKRPSRRELVGVVVSDKMQKTIVVKVDRRVRHKLYQKYLVHSNRFKAHDEKNIAKVGDLVSIIETRPLSRDKFFALKQVIRKATQFATVNVAE